MLNLPAPIRVFLYVVPTDMRKSFSGLHGLIVESLEKDPLSGDWFVFVNRRRDRLKIMTWEQDGFSIWYKKIESDCPHFLLFTEFGGAGNNLARRPVATGGMDSISTRIGPRRRPMLRQIAVPAPPRAQFFAVPKVSPLSGAG